MPINSKQKGKVVEREARDLVLSFGFYVRRGQQFKGGAESPDLVSPPEECPDGLHPISIHIEVKGDRSIGIGTKALENALDQAERDAGARRAVVLWKEHRRGWRLSWRANGATLTVAGPDDIGSVLWHMEECDA